MMEESRAGEETVVDGEIVDEPASAQDVADFLADTVLTNEEALEDIEGMIRNVANISKERLSEMSGADFNSAASRGFEQSLALSEMQVGLAKYGKTPIGSVEGLITLRRALVDSIRDKTLLPKELQVRAAQLETDLKIVQIRQIHVVGAEGVRSEIAAMEANVALDQAKLKSRTAGVGVKRGFASVDIDEKLIERRTRNERIAKQIDAAHELRLILWKGIGRFVFKWVLIVGIPLIIVSNLIADNPKYRDTPLFGAVNAGWDAVYMPIRDGVVRSLHLESAPPPSPSPTKPKSSKSPR